jgi:hypothetical protein
MAVLGAERRPASAPAQLLQVQPPLALPPPGSARDGRAVTLRGLAPARQAPWRWVQALAQQQGLPGPGQAHARRARQCQAAPGLAVLRAF